MDRGWTERFLLPLAPRTLKWLEEITAKIREHSRVNVKPMQPAALLLDCATPAQAEVLLF